MFAVGIECSRRARYVGGVQRFAFFYGVTLADHALITVDALHLHQIAAGFHADGIGDFVIHALGEYFAGGVLDRYGGLLLLAIGVKDRGRAGHTGGVQRFRFDDRDLFLTDHVGAQQGDVAVLDQNVLPLLFRAAEVYRLQLAVVIERVVLDFRHAGGDRNGGQIRTAVERSGVDGGHPVLYGNVDQRFTILKRIAFDARCAICDDDGRQIFLGNRHFGNRKLFNGFSNSQLFNSRIAGKRRSPDARHTVSDSHGDQPRTVVKRGITNASHAVWDAHRSQPRAAGKCVAPDARHTVRDDYGGQVCAAGKCVAPDARHTIPNCHACKICAIFKCITFNTCHAIRNCHRRQPRAAVKRVIPDARHAVRDHEIFYFAAVQIQMICIIQRIGITIVEIDAAPRLQTADVDLCQARTAGKCVAPDARHAVWNGHRNQPRAAVKRVTPDARYAVRDGHRRQPRAAGKRATSDVCHAVRDCHRSQPRAAVKRVTPDACHASIIRHQTILIPENQCFTCSLNHTIVYCAIFCITN